MTEAVKLDKGRRLARRQFAYLSFCFLLFFAVMVTGTLLWSAERKDVAEALTAASGAITGVISTMTLIVLSYLGVSLVEAMKKGPEA